MGFFIWQVWAQPLEPLTENFPILFSPKTFNILHHTLTLNAIRPRLTKIDNLPDHSVQKFIPEM